MAAKALRDKALVFLDTETTGLDPIENDIIEFAAIRISGTTEYRYQVKIKMERPENAHPKALEVNGYTEEAWVAARTLPEVLPEIVDLLKDAIVIGHNPDFDMNFIKAACKRHGIDARLPYQLIDTTTLAFEHLGPAGLTSLSLVNVCKFLGISTDGAHTAMHDVLACREVYTRLSRAGFLKRLFWRLRAKND